jgi:tetratricopeptide (TPR) repeat protein
MARFYVTSDQSTQHKTCSASWLLAAIALLTPLSAQGQCPPLVDSIRLKAAESESRSSEPPEFFDEPQFTVAGVTDPTKLGGHGSDTILRTKEELAKETAGLTREPTGKSQPAASSSIGMPENSLREAAEREPNNFKANRELGKFLVENGKGREAISYLERASRLNPGDYENGHELVLAYVDVGRYDEADKEIQEMLSREKRQQTQADLHHLLGDIDEKHGNALEAVRQYQQAAELDRSERNIFDWGVELLVHGAPEPAIEVLEKGNRRFPHSVRLLTALGVAWYIRGSYEQAAQRLCEASDLVPNDPSPYLFLGKLQAVGTAPSREITVRLERFARLQPENALANYYYAVSLWKQRNDSAENVAQIETLLNKAVYLDPSLSAGYLQLGTLYSEMKDFPKAITAYKRSIQIDPRVAEPHYRLAQAYKRVGEALKAQQELQLYDQVSKEKAEESDRERHEIQRFVYTLRRPPPAPLPQSR